MLSVYVSASVKQRRERLAVGLCPDGTGYPAFLFGSLPIYSRGMICTTFRTSPMPRGYNSTIEIESRVDRGGALLTFGGMRPHDSSSLAGVLYDTFTESSSS